MRQKVTLTASRSMSMTGKESQADSDIKADAKSSLISVTRHRDKDLLTSKCGEFDSLTCSKAGKEENFSLITCLVDEDKFYMVLPRSLTMLY